jgi:hypothetical protein
MRFVTTALIAVLILAGCTNDREKGLCPTAAILTGTAALTVFKVGAEHDPSNEIYTVYMTDVRGNCDFTKERNTTDTKVRIMFRAKRAPSAEGVTYRVPYFVAVTHSGNVISKQVYYLDFAFAPGASTAAFEETVDSATIKMAHNDRVGEYEILAGLQLTHDQLKYNTDNYQFTPH